VRSLVTALESSSWVSFAPGAHGVCIAVYTLRTVGDTPALGVESHIRTAFGDLGPSTAGLFQLCGLFRRQDKAHHKGCSHVGDLEASKDYVEE
jgi:hypothetical protein